MRIIFQYFCRVRISDGHYQETRHLFDNIKLGRKHLLQVLQPERPSRDRYQVKYQRRMDGRVYKSQFYMIRAHSDSVTKTGRRP